MVDTKTFRQETRSWLEENCPESMRVNVGFEDIFMGGKTPEYKSEDQKVWFEKMRDKGWTAPQWPKEYGGGGLSKDEYRILRQEMAKINCRPPMWSFGLAMLGPALLKFGNDEQKAQYLTEITQGDVWWCQGYSEPGAGSDLASLQTRAEDKGDHFLVSGQKVWTSYADKADMIFCLVRTNPDVPKQHGISFLLIDMKAEGVSTAPIKLISGKSAFCETFFDNVKVPKENLVGGLNAGWTIAKYLLTHERSSIGTLPQLPKSLLEVALDEVGLENGELDDMVLRNGIAQFLIDATAFNMTLERGADEAKAGSPPGAKSSFYKYYGSELNKRRFELLLSAQGFDGLSWGDEYKEGKLARDMCRTKANSIEGGTSEVQLNIISKRIIGLPSK
ncbi:MAG: acyl-CoA dehydrogenase family protein [Bacteroidota bacterium]